MSRGLGDVYKRQPLPRLLPHKYTCKHICSIHTRTRTHMHMHTHTRASTGVHTHTYTCAHTHTRTRAPACTHMCTHTRAHTHTCTHAPAHPHIYVHAPTHTQMHTRACTHTHTHMYTLTHTPEPTSHSLQVLSMEPVAMSEQSQLNCALLISALWPTRDCTLLQQASTQQSAEASTPSTASQHATMTASLQT